MSEDLTSPAIAVFLCNIDQSVKLPKQKVFLFKNRLSVVDKLILKEILSSNENMISTFLSKKLRIPVTTIQKRRKRLETNFLELEYSLLLEKFGWRRVDFFISTIGGMTYDVTNKILGLKQVILVGKSIGAHSIDLRVQAIAKG